MQDRIWTPIGGYDVLLDSEEFRIYPKNKRGETMPVTVSRQYVHLKCHRTGNTTTFKHYKHRRQWFWGDSRRKGSVPTHHVVREIARMLFDGGEQHAKMLIFCALHGITDLSQFSSELAAA